MISRELLSEVLSEEYSPRLAEWMEIKDNCLRTYYDCGNHDSKGRPTGLGIEINIHELAFKCKEWAVSKRWILHEVRNLKEYIIYFSGDCREPSDDFRADTEPEAIFKACAWIKDNK